MHRHRGFTLIELLVVIAIIAILAAILFPVFARAREKARQTSCLSNIKELATAVHMYVQDYDERMPGYMIYTPGNVTRPYSGGTANYLYWMDMLWPYVMNRQIYRCPSYASTSDTAAFQGYGWNAGVGYCLNHPTRGSNASPPSPTGYYDGYILAEVVYPAQTICIFDANNICVQGDLTAAYHVNSAAYSPWSIRHNEGDNFAFCDGHAKWVKYTQYSTLKHKANGTL